MRSPITLTSTASDDSTMVRFDTGYSAAASRIWWVCSPISRDTVCSSTYWMVDQFIQVDSRAGAERTTGVTCPTINPATTTASTPEAWKLSASA